MPVLSKIVQRGLVPGQGCRKSLLRELTKKKDTHRREVHKPANPVPSQSTLTRANRDEHLKAASTVVQERYRSNAIALEDIEQIDTITKESVVKPFEEIPGPPPLSLLGTIVQRLPGGRLRKVDSAANDTKMYQEYGPIVKESIGNTFTIVHLFDPTDIETVYRSDGKIPQRHAFFMLEVYNKRSNHVQGLLTSHDEHWAHLRKNVQQKMLRPKAVSAYLADQSIVGDDLMSRIEELRDQNGEINDLRDTLYKYATECVGVVCFNVRLGALKSHTPDSETINFIKAVKTVMDVSHQEFMKFPFYRWFNTPMFNRMSKAQEVIREMAAKYSDLAVKTKMGEDDEISGEEGDLIPYLITKTSMTKSEVHTVISEFIFAGVDTTSHYLAFAVYALAKFPEKQAILTAEIDKVVNGKDITASHMGHMPYLRAVLKETLRYLPVAPGNCRTTAKDVICSGYKLPKGTFVGMHNDFIQRQDKYFKEANQFVPERWLRGKDQESVHPFASLPFGFGSRSCIGKRFAEQEVSLALIKILKKYRVECLQDNLKLKKSITYTPVEPLKLRFIYRS